MNARRLEDLLGRFIGLKMAVIGDVIMDHYIWGDVARVSPEAPVPLIDVDKESHRLGGAANVALNLGTLGVDTGLFGRVGKDADGERLSDLCRESGLGWLGDLAPRAERTIVKSRVVARNQQLCRLDREGRRVEYALSAGAWEAVLPQILDGRNGVLVSDYAKGVVDNTFLSSLKAAASRTGLPVFCDPKPRFGRDFSDLELLTPNRAEAVAMSGIEWDPKDPFPAEEVVARIQERYRPRFLVITLGAEGMLFAEQGEVGGIIPTFAREVFDVSGAGDTVISLLSASLLVGANLEEAVNLANTAAGVVVGKLGTAVATREEILLHARQHWLKL